MACRLMGAYPLHEQIPEYFEYDLVTIQIYFGGSNEK